jgi:hypothetical protein
MPPGPGCGDLGGGGDSGAQPGGGPAFLEFIRSSGYSGLDVDLHPLQGESHSSGYAASVSLSLRLLYGLEG